MASIRKYEWKTSKGKERKGYRVAWTDNRTGKRRTRMFPRWAEADAFRHQIEGALKSGTYSDAGQKLTLHEMISQYLAHCAQRVEQDRGFTPRHLATVRSQMRWVTERPETAFGPTLIVRDIAAPDIEEFKERLLANKCSIGNARRILSCLKTVFRFAASRGYVAYNPAENIKVVGPRDEAPQKVTAPALEDVHKLIDIAPPWFGQLIWFAALTGLRCSEIFALTWRHVDLAGGTVRVEQRAVDGVISGPKSAAGRREVLLPDDLIAKLKAHKLQSKFSKLDDYVFASPSGKVLQYANVRTRYWRPLFKKAGVEPFGMHSLRHLAASLMIEAGMAPKELQHFIGHASVQLTYDVYGHMLPREDHRSKFNAMADRLKANCTDRAKS